MGVPGNADLLLLKTAAGATGYQVSRSLRFNSADSAYLNRTPASTGNQKTYTLSMWVKRTKLGTEQQVFNCGNTFIAFDSSDKIYANHRNGATNYFRISTAVYRDPSAWYHIVWAVDTTNGTTQNRARIWVNGAEITVWDSNGSIPQDHQTEINTTTVHSIGRIPSLGQYADLYLADVWFLDGIAADPSSFAETDATTGQWIPKTYSGSKGSNGFHLEFADNSNNTASTLGKDTSGNSNNWTPNNLSVTAGAGNDSLVDTPTSYGTDTGAGGEVRGNYCTWNPLDRGSQVTVTNGNLDITASNSGSPYHSIRGTIGLASGKWYWEVNCTTVSGDSPSVGVATPTASMTTYLGNEATSWAYILATGNKGNNGNTGQSYGNAVASGDVVGVAVDVDAGKIWFSKNGTWQASGSPSAGTNAAFTNLSGTIVPAAFVFNNSAFSLNAGARAFAYTAPSGFKALCDTNLPAPVVAKGSTVFDVKLYTGNGSTQTISGLGFSPDLAWIKSRSSAYDNILFDTVRTATKQLIANSFGAEATYASSLTAFNSDGFSVGSDAVINNNASTYVAWAWDAGSSNTTNTAGSITSTVRVNVTAGFSIVTYTGVGSTGTVGHSLGVAPSFYIVKARTTTAANSWRVYHSALGNTKQLFLEDTAAALTNSSAWNNTSPTSTVFSVGSLANESSGNYVAYVFSPVVGYSSMGSYVGNGSSDGPFVYTGFRPKWLLYKDATAASDWAIVDATRGTYNVIGPYLLPNSSGAEGTATIVDFTANGFKIRNSGAGPNGSGNTHIYAAFAESPFQYARAR